MRNIKAIVLLLTVAAVSAATVFYGGVTLAFSDTFTATSSLPSSHIEEHTNTIPQKEEPQSEVSSSATATPPAETSSESIIVSENHTVSGKIISKTINPKSAALSASGVYMKNSSGADIDIKTELAAGTKIHITKNAEPQVLIMHTHTTESYVSESRNYYTKDDASRSTDNNRNMAAIGDIITAKVEAAGYGVIHDTTQHDYPSYSGSYDRSKETIKAYLKKYPSIKIVIDVHRDALAGDGTDKIKLVKEIEGKNAAQVMLVMGSQTGKVTGYQNWRQNLRLAMLFHQKIEKMYPGLARPMVVASKLYNQHLTTGSMLIEIGTDANSLEEAKYSAELVGNSLVSLLADLS
ncbi:MAG: stage II sporulation protein P [Ruminococcaceae bacterium]|nr:stage II sporulation protein P [Oscillospiraceae bacterium]